MSMMTDNTSNILTQILQYLNANKRRATTFEIKTLPTKSEPQNAYCIECTRYGLKQTMVMLLDIYRGGSTLKFKASLPDVHAEFILPTDAGHKAPAINIKELGLMIIKELDYDAIKAEIEIRGALIDMNETLRQVERLTRHQDKQLSELSEKYKTHNDVLQELITVKLKTIDALQSLQNDIKELKSKGSSWF